MTFTRVGSPSISSVKSFSIMSCVLMATMLRHTAAEIYMVRMADPPVLSYTGTVPGLKATAASPGRRADVDSAESQSYITYLTNRQDSLLAKTLQAGTYTKLYTYHYLINGFAVQTTPEQAKTLAGTNGVVQVEEDRKVEKMTTHTPDFLGLPDNVWPKMGGVENAGEGVIIGVVDTGINPSHPSFAVSSGSPPYGPISSFKGICEEAPEFPQGSCNGKIIGARHFAVAATAGGDFNASRDFASPFDADGHGSHTAATAAGNHGVSVTVKGYNYGTASGMAPRARLAIYKALYPFGGYISDVVAGVDQAVQDGVDIISLSLGPTSAPTGVSTFLNVFEVELLFAVRAGVFVAQAAGNNGPAQASILSFSPWITSVAASITDRTYPDSLRLGNNDSFFGVGLSRSLIVLNIEEENVLCLRDQAEDLEYSLVSSFIGKPLTLFNSWCGSASTSKGSVKLVHANDAASRNGTVVNIPECQQPAAFNKDLVQGNVLLCVYSFSFEFGSATVKQVAQTANVLGAAGFLLVSDPALGAASKADPSPLQLPGIIVTDLNASIQILRYYNESTIRDATGAVKDFGAYVTLEDGRVAEYGAAAPVVATFSSRGPDVLNSQSQFADVMKPDILAPGYLIWSAWSPIGADDSNFYGEEFAMLSGTSMATPHIAGIAALLKQAHPLWTPAVITSALMTTAGLFDNTNSPILAQNPTGNFSSGIGPGTPFDYGAGAVDAGSALDPGLVFEARFEDYVSFLCVVPGVDPASVHDATGTACAQNPSTWASDLNKPYITIANLVGSRTVTRTMTNVGLAAETYTVSLDREPPGISVTINPQSFTAKQGESVPLFITVKSTTSTTNVFSFGSISLSGDHGHRLHMPLAISSNSAVS